MKMDAYILAGGQSRRMGRNKLFIKMNEQPLLVRMIVTCREVFASVSLVVKDQSYFNRLGCRILIDKPGIEGPLAGVITAIDDSRYDKLFVTAADLYDLSPEIIQNLLKEYSGEQHLGIREVDHIQSLCGIYTKTALDPLLRAAEAGKTRMSEAIRELECRFIPPPSGDWRNINSPEDLKSMGVSID